MVGRVNEELGCRLVVSRLRQQHGRADAQVTQRFRRYHSPKIYQQEFAKQRVILISPGFARMANNKVVAPHQVIQDFAGARVVGECGGGFGGHLR